jgi:hypothetical protein
MIMIFYLPGFDPCKNPNCRIGHTVAWLSDFRMCSTDCWTTIGHLEMCNIMQLTTTST